jgi:F-type H+-transporting ATPase subunit b
MENLLSVSPGLIIWTIINFLVFLFLIVKFGAKPIANGLKTREDRINNAILNAEKANEEARKLLIESQEKISTAQEEMAGIVAKGRQQAVEIIHAASDEADKIKRTKVEDALREIEHSKENAIIELRRQVAGLVVQATEKILGNELDQEKHIRLVEDYIKQIPNN